MRFSRLRSINRGRHEASAAREEGELLLLRHDARISARTKVTLVVMSVHGCPLSAGRGAAGRFHASNDSQGFLPVDHRRRSNGWPSAERQSAAAAPPVLSVVRPACCARRHRAGSQAYITFSTLSACCRQAVAIVSLTKNKWGSATRGIGRGRCGLCAVALGSTVSARPGTASLVLRGCPVRFSLSVTAGGADGKGGKRGGPQGRLRPSERSETHRPPRCEGFGQLPRAAPLLAAGAVLPAPERGGCLGERGASERAE